MSFLTLSGISRRVGETQIVKGIRFAQEEFQRIAIAGETGSGKSTLLKIIAGLVQADSGEVIWQGRKVMGPEERLVPGEPGIAYLSQHFELPKSLRVNQVLAYARRLPEARAAKISSVCRVDHLMERRTDELSGGERQRIALAQVLVGAPRLLLLDEPYSHLDVLHKTLLKTVVDDIVRKLKTTMILVSHDPIDLLSWADHVLVMRKGKIIQRGQPETVYYQPASPYAAGLFGNYNLLSEEMLHKFFPGQPLHFPKGKRMMIRPENFKFTGIGGVAASVLRSQFNGSFTDVEMQVGDDVLIMRAHQPRLNCGDTVYLKADNQNYPMI